MNKRIFARQAQLLPVLLLLGTAVSCGGGGGGGGGSDGRTRETALRIIHASIDGSPLNVLVDGLPLQRARFAQVTDFVPVERGAHLIRVERVNSPGVVLNELTFTLEDETEYTLFVSGAASDGSESAVLLPEPVVRPDEGMARVQFLNGVSGSGALTLQGTGIRLLNIDEGATSGFVDAAMGPQTFRVLDGAGAELAQIGVELPDRGEVSIVAAGSSNLGVVFTRAYLDLD